MQDDTKAEFWLHFTYRGKPDGIYIKVKYSLRALFADRDTSTEYGVFGIRDGKPVQIVYTGDDEWTLLLKPETVNEFRIMKDRYPCRPPHTERRVPYEMELTVQVFKEKAAALSIRRECEVVL